MQGSVSLSVGLWGVCSCESVLLCVQRFLCLLPSVYFLMSAVFCNALKYLSPAAFVGWGGGTSDLVGRGRLLLMARGARKVARAGSGAAAATPVIQN